MTKTYSLKSVFRKGNAPTEIIVILVILIIFGLTAMMMYKVMSPINDQIQKSTSGFPNVTKQIFSSNTKAYPVTFDNLIFFTFIILIIAAIGFSFLIDIEPIFFVITIIAVIAGSVGIAFVANSSISLVNGLGVSASYPKTTWLFQHLLEIYVVIGLVITGVLYAKNRNN